MIQPCRICASTESRVCVDGPGTWHCYEPALGAPFPYQVRLCQQCGHVFGAWPQDMSRLYHDQEYVTCEGDLPSYASFVPFVLAGLSRGRRTPRVLEIGFNRGALLKHFYDLGFECHGVEPGEANVEAAQRKMPRAALNVGEFNDHWAHRYEPGYFDLVIITSVLEHLPRPMDTLRTIRRSLAPLGRVFIVVPDLAFYAPTWQIPKEKRDQYGCSQLLFFYRNIFLCYAQHINHFSGPSLTRYLSAAGLRTMQVAHVGYVWVSAARSKFEAYALECPDLVGYHEDLMDYYGRTLRDMRAAMYEKLRGRRLVCYGAGRDFGYFLEVFRPMGIEPVAVADDALAVPSVKGVRRMAPAELRALAPDVCLATSFDYENQIAAKARALLPESVEVLTLTDLIYEYEVRVRPWMEIQLMPVGRRPLWRKTVGAFRRVGKRGGGA